MKTYRIVHSPSGTDFLTTDFTDIWSETDKLPDGETLQITVTEMTMKQFEDAIRLRKVMNLSMRLPWKDGSERID